MMIMQPHQCSAIPEDITEEDMEKPEYQLAHKVVHGELRLSKDGVPEGMEFQPLAGKFRSKEMDQSFDLRTFQIACERFKIPPPCASWHIWTGLEIEGTESIGEKTLFVRHFIDPKTDCILSPLQIFSRAKEQGVDRVWFCEECHNVTAIADALNLFRKVCVCVDATEKFGHILSKAFSADDLLRIRFYLKLGELFPLKYGDFLCVGPKFRDTAYGLCESKTVQTADYSQDQIWY